MKKYYPMDYIIVKYIHHIKASFKTYSIQQLKDAAKHQKDLVKQLVAVGYILKAKIKLEPYDEQYLGAFHLIRGHFINMNTGGGKTITALLSATVMALNGHKVHILTLNNYLAQRDCEFAKPIYESFGLSTGTINDNCSDQQKAILYNVNIAYLTGQQIGFDFLRDKSQYSLNSQFVNLDYAIVDEADSILIDQAQTPLIISNQGQPISPLLRLADICAKQMTDKDVFVSRSNMMVNLSDSGMKIANRMFDVDNIYHIQNKKAWFFLSNALKAKYLYRKNHEYLIQNGKIVLIDAVSQRPAPNRSLNDGLQQAIAAKEGIHVPLVMIEHARIDYPTLMRCYKQFSGMSGTANLAKHAFKFIYNKSVVNIPQHVSSHTNYLADRIFTTKSFKLRMLANKVKTLHNSGIPVLVGCHSVDDANQLEKYFTSMNIMCSKLTAENVAKEAELIKKAGQKNRITIATDLAGRGTDIPVSAEVNQLGGLAIIIDGRSKNRRIDEQFAGRTGRNGQNGSVQFYISLEDELIALHLPSRIQKDLYNLNYLKSSHCEIYGKWANRQAKKAQLMWEGQDTKSLEYNESLNYSYGICQRKFYMKRDAIMLFLAKMATNNHKIAADQTMIKDVLTAFDDLWAKFDQYSKQYKKEVRFEQYGNTNPIITYTCLINNVFNDLFNQQRIQKLINDVVQNKIE